MKLSSLALTLALRRIVVGVAMLGAALTVSRSHAAPASPAPVPYHQVVDCIWQGSSSSQDHTDIVLPAIPAGKRLVIESISLYGVVPAGQSAVALLRGVPVVGNTDQFFHNLSLQKQGTFGGVSDVVTGTHALRLIADAKNYQHLRFEILRTGQGPGALMATVSGYLEIAP